MKPRTKTKAKLPPSEKKLGEGIPHEETAKKFELPRKVKKGEE